MNCKPGDLARVINDRTARELGIVDKFFRLTHVAGKTGDGSLCWAFEGPPIPHPSDRWTTYDGISDAILRPVRDPGDDAQDESRAWLPPVPLATVDPSLLPAKEQA
jgi:hypothetical protein